METFILKDQRKSERIPLALTVLAEVDNRRIGMSSDNISLDGMFLFSRYFIPSGVMFPAQIWLTDEQPPLQVYLNTCFIERTKTGYGVGVYISGIAAADAVRWEKFYRDTLTAHTACRRQLAAPERPAGSQRVLVVEGALNRMAMQALRKQGLEVFLVESVSQAIEVTKCDAIAAIVCDLHRSGQDGLALCCQVHHHRLATRTILVTSEALAKEFLLGMYVGATRVIAKQCSNEILVARLLEVLAQPIPAGRAQPTGQLASAVA